MKIVKRIILLVIFVGAIAFGIFYFTKQQPLQKFQAKPDEPEKKPDPFSDPNSTVASGEDVPGVIFYQDINYGGPQTRPIPPGNYTLSQLKDFLFLNDWASSVKIPKGWIVRTFADDNWKYPKKDLYTSTPDFRSFAANDMISSVQIVKA